MVQRGVGKAKADEWKTRAEGWGSEREELSMSLSRGEGAESERLETSREGKAPKGTGREEGESQEAWEAERL